MHNHTETKPKLNFPSFIWYYQEFFLQIQVLETLVEFPRSIITFLYFINVIPPMHTLATCIFKEIGQNKNPTFFGIKSLFLFSNKHLYILPSPDFVSGQNVRTAFSHA